MNGTEQAVAPESMRILAADLSLRCPGFAVLNCLDGKVSIEKLCHLSSKNSKAGHGQILSEIYDILVNLSQGIDIFVRERAFYRFPHETQALFKVVGIADMVAWQQAHAIYQEISPTAVKKLLVGSGKATKHEVAVA